MAKTQPSTTTLTSVTYFSRVAVIWFLVFLIAVLLGKLTYDGFLNFLDTEKCKRPEPVARLESKIPPLNFPRQSSYQKATSYTLQLPGMTANASGIPETPSKMLTMRVYPQILPLSNVSADTRVRDIASKIGLTGDPEIINAEIYRWQNGNTIFEINRRTLTFNYKTDFMSNTEYLHSPGKTLPTSAEATRLVKDQLKNIDLLPADMATKAAAVAFVKAVGNELVPVTTVDQSDFIQVALQREDIVQSTTDDKCRPIDNKYPFVRPGANPSSIIGIVGRNWTDQDLIVSLISTYEDYDWDNYGIYSSRTLEDAWGAVQAGNAYVANLGTTSDVIINSFRIAYFEDSQEQSYLQPVYVFESDSGHKAYVPALASSEFDANKLLSPGSGNLVLPSALGATGSSTLSTPSSTLPSN